MPLTVAVFLVIGFLGMGGWFLEKSQLIEERGILGGPDSGASSLVQSAQGAELALPAAVGDPGSQAVVANANSNPSGDAGNYSASLDAGALVLDTGSIKDSGQPVGPAFDRSGTITYTVRSGDSLSKIASYFGISVDTIASANPGVRGSIIKVGQQLKILPTTGVIYQTRVGDTIDTVANLFGIPKDKIAQFNPSVNFTSLDPGVSIVIPGGKNMSRIATGGASLPNFNNQFVMPTDGYNWGILHHYNAVDIANSCGTPVVASAEGLVVPDDSMTYVADGWNGGYGNFVLIEHPFGDGVRTRYAHLEKVLVQIGDYVKQGQTIGIMGETGDATGCHVHFEVIGALNPFAKS